MLNRIIYFFYLLRHLGLRISSGEAVTAVEGLSVINLADPPAVKTVFLASLAKSAEEQLIVEKAFEGYFITPEAQKIRHENSILLKLQEEIQMQEADQALSYVLEGPPGEEDRQVSLPISEDEKRAYIHLPEEKKKRIQDYLNRAFQRNSVNNPEPLITKIVSSSINTWKYQLGLEENALPDFLDPLPTGNDEIDNTITEVMSEVISEVRAENNLLYQDISKIAETDTAEAMRIVRKMSRRLATRISRRYRKSVKKTKPDLRRTVRHNIRYGGIMFELKYKTRKISRPKLLILCDVSGSMARYAGFVLHFIYGLVSILDKIDCFVFSESINKISLRKFSGKAQDKPLNKTMEKTMADLINSSEIWGRGTDLSNALIHLMGEYKSSLSQDTHVIIVSDTRTIGVDKAEEALTAFHTKVQDILWLNPLPKGLWERTQGPETFGRFSRMFECSNLAQLNSIMSNQVFR